ncbi:MAG: glycosyltransferase family 39 protein [Chloroflexi bacterium]|nr:glycosyltransferase family 39 protein [Chloroflexota bacterium]
MRRSEPAASVRERGDVLSRALSGRWMERLAAIALLWVATFLRLWDLGLVQYRQDDDDLRQLVLGMLHPLSWPVAGMHSSLGLSNGPFQVLLLALAGVWANSPPGMTAIVALLNVLACACVYGFARDFLGRRVALLALLFVAINPWSVVLSRRLWGDDLVAPAAVLAAWMLCRWRFRGDQRSFVVGLVALAIACQVYIVGLELLLPATLLILSGMRSLRWRPALLGGLAFAVLVAPYTLSTVLPRITALTHIERPSGAVGDSRPPQIDLQSTDFALELASAEGYQTFAPPAGELFDVTSGWAQVINVVARALYAAGMVIGGGTLLRNWRRISEPPIGVHLYLLTTILVPVLALVRHSVPVYPYYLVTTFPAAALYPAYAVSRLWDVSAVTRLAVPIARGACIVAVVCIVTLDLGAAEVFFQVIGGYWPLSQYGMPWTMTEQLATTTLRYAQARHASEIVVPGHTQELAVLAHVIARTEPHTVEVNDEQTVLLPGRIALYVAIGDGFTQSYLARTFPQDLLAQETLPGGNVHAAWYLLTPRDRSRALAAGTHLNWTASWQGQGMLHLERLSVPTRIHPGEDVAALAMMTVERQAIPPYSIYLHLIDQTGRPIAGQDQAMPAGGALAPGDVIVEQFDLHVGKSAEPNLITAHLGAYVVPASAGVSLEYLQWRAAGGNTTVRNAPVAQLVIPPLVPQPPEHPVHVVFGEGVVLAGYDLRQRGRQLEVVLHWLATQRLDENRTAFVHVLDSAGKLIAQNDSPPAAGAFPTAFWRAGDAVLDRHVIQLPVGLAPGTYRLEVGMYNPTTIRRLPVVAGDPLLRVQLSGT